MVAGILCDKTSYSGPKRKGQSVLDQTVTLRRCIVVITFGAQLCMVLKLGRFGQ